MNQLTDSIERLFVYGSLLLALVPAPDGKADVHALVPALVIVTMIVSVLL